MEGYLADIRPLPAGEAVVLATTEDIDSVSDMPERNIQITRWHKNGRALCIRVRAPDLPQLHEINQAAFVLNRKTNEREQSEPAYCAAVLQRCVVSPILTQEKAEAWVKKNPIVIRRLVYFITEMMPLDDALIENMAAAVAALPAAPTDGDTANE